MGRLPVMKCLSRMTGAGYNVGTADRELDGDVPCLVDQDGQRRAAGPTMAPPVRKLLIRQDRGGQPSTPCWHPPSPVEMRTNFGALGARSDSHSLRSLIKRSAEAAARVQKRRAVPPYGVEIDLFALEIVELNVWRLAADLDTARRRARPPPRSRGEQVASLRSSDGPPTASPKQCCHRHRQRTAGRRGTCR